ncbi:MAG: hypothetical protein CMH53_00100 [Myxococcales bacterium]|nr:hypothetical protein [Myxococcales bacterium]
MDLGEEGGARSVCILCHCGVEAGPLVREQCTGRKWVHEPACVHDACKAKALAQLSAIDSAQEGRSRRKKFQNTLIKKNAMDTLCVLCLQRSGGLENLHGVKTSFMKHYARRAECFDSGLRRVRVEEPRPDCRDGQNTQNRPTANRRPRQQKKPKTKPPPAAGPPCMNPMCTRRARSSGMCYACEKLQCSFDVAKQYFESAKPAEQERQQKQLQQKQQQQQSPADDPPQQALEPEKESVIGPPTPQPEEEWTEAAGGWSSDCEDCDGCQSEDCEDCHTASPHTVEYTFEDTSVEPEQGEEEKLDDGDIPHAGAMRAMVDALFDEEEVHGAGETNYQPYVEMAAPDVRHLHLSVQVDVVDGVYDAELALCIEDALRRRFPNRIRCSVSADHPPPSIAMIAPHTPCLPLPLHPPPIASAFAAMPCW